MRRFVFVLSAAVLLNFVLPSYALKIKGDVRAKEAKYLYKIQKKEEKDVYGKKVLNYKPTGYMTVEEYEELSKYNEDYKDPETPKVQRSDLKYVPQPSYKIVRYNDPPGSPELNITKKFYQLRQYNGQGVVAPDYSMIVYPVVYYYPNSASTASDIFVIPIDKEGAALEKIKSAKAQNRWPEPIVSTEKSVDNDSAFRTLTPVDFSADGKKVLIKEKIGSSQDGIWKTNAIVYDFETKNAYNLVEVRDAIIYYWKENKKLDLDECRWDIYPLGFLLDEPNRIAVNAYGFTGDKPINLGIWSVDIHGEQSRLISFKQSEVNFSINGFKVVQDGVVARDIVEKEQKAQKKMDKRDAKAEKRKEKADLRQLKTEYKDNIREINYAYKEERKDLRKLNSLKGSTTFNELPEEFKQYKIKELEKSIKSTEKKIKKQEKQVQKIEKELEKEVEKTVK